MANCIALLLNVPVCYLLSIRMSSSLKGSIWEAPLWAGLWLLYQAYFIVVIIITEIAVTVRLSYLW